MDSPQTKAPAVPLTLEGAPVLHLMIRFRWSAWRQAPAAQRHEALHGLRTLLESWGTQSGLFSLLGHKGDLLLIHFRRSFQELNEAELAFAHLPFFDFCEIVNSYLSVVELGLYESTGKTYSDLTNRGVVPHSDEWNAGITEVLDRQSRAMASRLFPEMPSNPFVCFYPMDRRRGEHKNWYSEPMAERARMMAEHGAVGRRYAGQVRQIISGSIGFDDWEWGVDLFADDPLIFKKLIYEMRFDEVSAVYALFGSFFVGLRVMPPQLDQLLKVSS